MGKRALVTQITHTHTTREGFTVDPFWGATAPPAISAFGAAIEEGGRDKLRAALGLAVQDLEGKELDEPALLEIGTPLFVGARAVLSAAVRANAQESDLVRDLGSLRIQEEHVQDILLAMSRGKERMTKGVQSGLRFPAVDDVRWRVDVTISTTALSRVLRPSVLLQLQLSDGCLETFALSAEQLQTLRYDVACALRSLQDLHASPQLSKLAAARSGAPASSRPPAAPSPAAKSASSSPPKPAKPTAPPSSSPSPPAAAPAAAAPALPTF